MKRAALWRWRRIPLWVAWVRQGRPRDEPVVVKAGKVIVCRHGYAQVTGWSWDVKHQEYVIDADDLVDRYSARYQQHRVSELDCCPACTADPRIRITLTTETP